MLRFLFLALVVSIHPLFAVGGEERPATIRVMTYNIHHGRGMDDRVDLERIAEVIRREKPDIVALQEVDRGMARTGRRDLTAELARLTEMTGYFENNHAMQGGEYGNALLSRLPILEQKNTLLPRLNNSEQRGLLQMVVECDGQKLLVLNTHFAHRRIDEEERLQSVEKVAEVAAQYPGLPVILAGDFNAGPGSAVHRNLKENFIDVWEASGEGPGFMHSSQRPERRIDYIWVSRDSGLTPRSSRVVESLASDHLPLVAEIEWER